jgi:general secretion pathway protein J
MSDSRLPIPCADHLRGFTLLEVLIALSLVSVILAALYSTFFLSRKAVDAVDDSLLRLQESRAVLDVMKREIESALYDSNKSYTLFKLEDEDCNGTQVSRITFTTFSPRYPGLAKVEYRVVEHEERLTLVKSLNSAYAKSADIKATELIEDLDSFAVEIRFKDIWVKTWDTSLAGSIPGELRISIKIKKKEQEKPSEREGSFPLFIVSDIARPKIGRTL